MFTKTADHVSCFEMVNSGMRRNLWSAANSEIIQSLIYIVGKAKFMETSVLEGELILRNESIFVASV